MPVNRNPYRHAFTLTTPVASQNLFMEEARCLLNPLGIKYGLVRRKLTRNAGTSVFNLFIRPHDEPVVRGGLERLVSGRAMLRASSAIINRQPHALSPEQMVYPLLHEEGRVRHLISPARGVASAKQAALAVNLLGLAPGKKVLAPMMGWGSEAVAAALAGHSVVGGDISPWLKAGRARILAYVGRHGLELTPSQRLRVAESVRKAQATGLPLERLENIFHVRWDARRLPLGGGRFDAAVLDPPHNRFYRMRYPIKLARSVLNETARHLAGGAPVVIRVPARWSGRLETASAALEHIGTFPVGKGLVMMKFAKRPD
jgi:hypothetical protein